ncbi:MAG: hypothetical protein ACXWCF_05720 [Kaistella sp.]
MAFFLPLITFGQLKGTYCQSNGLFGDCYEFLDSNKFEYRYFSCTGGLSGIGYYSLKKKELILDFINQEIDTVKYLSKIEKENSETDSIIIDFLVIDKIEKDTIILSTGILKDKNGNRLKAKQSGFDGLGRITFKKSSDTFLLFISAPFHSEMTIPITLDSNYKIKVFLINTFYTSIDKGKETYKIKGIKNNNFYLKKTKYEKYVKRND